MKLRAHKQRRGAFLFAALPPALLAAGFVFLSLTSTVTDLRTQEHRLHRRRAMHQAKSALAVAHAKAKTAAYDARGNVFLRDALDTGVKTGMVTASGADVYELYIGDESEVWCAEIAPGLIQLDSMARVGDVTVQMRSLIRERDSFARYTLFINSRSVNLGSATSNGWMHTNRNVNFFYGGYTYPTVTARDGFTYKYGATEANTTFAADSNPNVAEIPMPSLGDIQNRAAHSDGKLTSLLGGNSPTNYDIHVEMMGDGYQLTAKHKSTGTVSTTGRIPLPTTGVIYIDGDVKGVQGKLDGRITLAVTGKVEITDSIQYVDKDGDTAYLNGLPANPSDPFVPNPNYDGNSALGIMAGGDVTYGSSVPNQLEVDAYVFSRGKFGVPSSSFGVRPTLRLLGGHAVETGVIGAYSNRSGTVTSGFQNRIYEFDSRLANNPPPHFLAVDEPSFGAYRLVNHRVIGSEESDGFAVQNLPLGMKERAAHATP